MILRPSRLRLYHRVHAVTRGLDSPGPFQAWSRPRQTNRAKPKRSALRSALKGPSSSENRTHANRGHDVLRPLLPSLSRPITRLAHIHHPSPPPYILSTQLLHPPDRPLPHPLHVPLAQHALRLVFTLPCPPPKRLALVARAVEVYHQDEDDEGGGGGDEGEGG